MSGPGSAMGDSNGASILDRKLSNRALLWIILICLTIVVLMRIVIVPPDRTAEAAGFRLKVNLDDGLRDQLTVGDRNALHALLVLTELPDFRTRALRTIEQIVPESAWEDRSPLASRDWLKANIDKLVFDRETKMFWTPEVLHSLRAATSQPTTQPVDTIASDSQS